MPRGDMSPITAREPRESPAPKAPSGAAIVVPMDVIGRAAIGALVGAVLLGPSGCKAPRGDATLTPAPRPQPATVQVRVLGFNDLHGALEPPSTGIAGEPAGGVAYLGAHLAQLRAEAEHSLVVAAGDLIGASPLNSSLLHDEPTIEALGVIGLEFASVGNHEFDEGRAELLRMQNGGCHPEAGCGTGDPFAGASFTYLAANVFTESDETLFPAYGVRQFGDVSVAVIGMTLEDTPAVTRPSGVEGLRFADEVETVNALVPQLQARGIETIVVVVHEGGEQDGDPEACDGLRGPIIAIAEAMDDAVDVLVTGHTHQAYVCEIGGKVVTSAGSSGRLVSQIDLSIDVTTGDVTAALAHNIPITHTVQPLSAAEKLVQRASTAAAHLTGREVGVLARDLQRTPNAAGESALGAVVADAQLAAARGAGSVVAFMNPGGIRDDLARGRVTFAEVFAVHPFENRLVTMTLTGAQLHALLEAQWREIDSREDTTVLQLSAGSSYTWHAQRPPGERVDPAQVVIGGQPLDLESSYRVTVNDFLASGGDGFGMLREGKDRVEHGTDAAALEAYLQQHAASLESPAPRIVRAR